MPGALPPLRTVIRHTSGMVRHCARGRPPLPSPSPTLRTAARNTVAQRRGLFSGAARTLPGSGRRANDILYIRVRRREGENVLHRAGRNDVDNFSVDNPLWITAAAGGRSLRGDRRRLCGGSVNAGAAGANVIQRKAKGYAGPPMASWENCERRGGNINADGAGAEVFAGDGCSQGASFGPMALISRRGQGGRIYNNTRTRELLRRKCVKPAALTTHSPPKAFARPCTATRPPRALPLPHAAPMHAHAAPTHARRLCDAFSADRTTHSPPKTFPRPRTATHPSRALPPAPTAQTHTRRLRDTFLAALTTHSPLKTCSRPRTATRPARALPLPLAAPTHTRRLRDVRPPTSQSIPRRRSPPLPLCSASGTKKRHRTVDVRCRMSRSTVVAVGHWGW